MNKTLATIIGAALIGTAAVSPAAAAEARQQSIEVKYEDLNLQTEKGMKTLEGRFSKAAREVCGTEEITTGSRIRSSEAADCYARAMTSARQQMAALRAKQSGKLG